MFEVKRYSDGQKGEWDSFVRTSKNATFLFYRDYMDYHSDRFLDCSLMVYRRGALYALLPANISDDGILYSHQGLTYGGLLTNERATASEVCKVFDLMNDFYRKEGVNKVVYKPVPWIYHSLPGEEDLYALFATCNAKLKERSVSSTICADRPVAWYRIRSMGARRAFDAGVVIEESDRLDDFWQILSTNLMNSYGVKPVHTVEEIKRLGHSFKENIRFVEAKLDGKMLGGVVLYVSRNVVHSQYIAASPEGKRLHVLDLLFQKLIEESLRHHHYFDFGISTEEHGTSLNESLIYQKEGFGGRAVCYDIYEWNL